MKRDSTHILGGKLDIISKKEMVDLFCEWINKKNFNHVVTSNPEICLLVLKDPDFHKIIKNSSLSVADGVGLIMATKILGAPRPQRITGREVMHELCVLAVNSGSKVFLLGGMDDAAEKTADKLRKRYQGLAIVGAEAGMTKQEFSYKSPELIRRINKAKPDILFVAFGAPKQEKWISHNKKNLKSVKIAVGVGGLFDYEAEYVKKPNQIIKTLGLEWLFRLITQPKRWKRIFNATFVFIYQVLRWKFNMMCFLRKNVVGVIFNDKDQLLLVSPSWSKMPHWQFPQGGRDKNESPTESILREMKEELGISQLRIVDYLPHAHSYIWPQWYRVLKGYKGQKQDIFILKYQGNGKDIDLGEEGELARWKWVDIAEVIKTLSPIRRNIGYIALSMIKNIKIKNT